jgi:hypothetical protein
MMKKKPYRIQVEVKSLEGTRLPSDVAGTYVNIYLGAHNIKEAIEIAETELLSDFYKPIGIHHAFEIDMDDERIEKEVEGYPLKADLMNLLNNGGIWYGPFHYYSPDDR